MAGSQKEGRTHLENNEVTHHESNAIDNDDYSYRVGRRTLLAIIALALANCNATLSNTTNTIISFQVRALAANGGATDASWIANGNFLMTLAFAPIFGSLADRLGKKWFIVGGCVLGLIGSFISSSAKDIYTIIGGNIVVGIGNAGCIVSIAANQEVTTNRTRPYAFGFAQTINSIAAILGTFLAAVFAQHASWAWSYRFNGIAYAVSAVAVLLSYRPPPTVMRRSATLKQILMEIDIVGMVLLAGSMACLVVGLTWGGTNYAWHSSMIIGLLVGGAVGLVVLGVFEWKIKTKNGLLDHRLFQNRNFPILCFVCLVDGMLLLGVNVLYSQEIATLFSPDATRIAVILSPYLITSTLGCLPAGWIMGKTHSYRALLVSALVWCGLFTGLMALVNADRLKWALAFSALFGIGTAVTTVIPIVALTLSVPSFILGTAGTLSISARALGGIVGITIFTAIYDNKIATKLPEFVGGVLVEAGQGQVVPDVLKALSSPVPPPVALSSIPGLPKTLIGPILQAATSAQAASWKFVWVAIACVVLANAICCCFLKSVKANMTVHVESALEENDVRRQQMGKDVPE